MLTCSLTSRGRCLTRRARPWWKSRWTCLRLLCAVWPLSTICQQSSGFKPPTDPDDILPLLFPSNEDDDDEDAWSCWTWAVQTGTGLSLPPTTVTAPAEWGTSEWAPAAAIIDQKYFCTRQKTQLNRRHRPFDTWTVRSTATRVSMSNVVAIFSVFLFTLQLQNVVVCFSNVYDASDQGLKDVFCLPDHQAVNN